MMETVKDFEEVRVGLSNQIDREVLGLKHYMEALDEEVITSNPDLMGKVVERIFYTFSGLEKLAAVLSFIDCWEENGEPPQLSYRASFMSKDEPEE